VTTVDDSGFAALARKISQGAGLALEVYKDKCIRRRIAVRMRACGVHTYADYQALLERSPAEYERLRDALTINVTRFYRNAETWNLLRRDLIPRLCAPGSGEIRVWSAGCSSGEEAYTIAILAAEHLDRAGRGGELERLTVDATDVDRLSLDRAQAARYRPENLTEMPRELVGRYLEPDGSELQVLPRIRNRVTVRRLDLSSGRPPRRDYHLVMCRNVLIYFDRPLQDRAVGLFKDALARKGFLGLGSKESLRFSAHADAFAEFSREERIYQKRGPL
jgi:chemotaxis methyl-accepting protein methylase